MAAPTPQEQKLSALEKALAGQRQSQEDAKAAGEKAKATPPSPASPGVKP